MRVSCERGRVVVIPAIVEPVVVRVPLSVVEVQVTDIQVAVLVAVMYRKPSAPPSIEYSLD